MSRTKPTVVRVDFSQRKAWDGSVEVRVADKSKERAAWQSKESYRPYLRTLELGM